jgi:hypothetical protein
VLCVQQIQHTNILFSTLYFAFFIMSVLAFNFADGFTRISGAYIFWYATLIVIVGVTWKIAVNEPADSNLQEPLLDMAVYTGSMGMLLLVAILNKKLDVRAMGFGGGFSKANMNYTAAGLGCVIVGYGIIFADTIFGQAPGGIISALVQVNVFTQLGIILATIGAIEDSGGRRSTNTISILAISVSTYFGILAFSKQQMITPMVCWLIGVFYARLKVRFVHIVAMIAMAIIAFGFFSPLSASRDLAESAPDDTARLEIVGYQITHWSEFQQHVKNLEEQENSGGVAGYYTNAQGSLIERLSMILPDDALISYSEKGHYEGIDPVVNYFENLLPHFVAPNKQLKYGGNYYDHEMGGNISADDYTTGISFSPVGEAFHCEGWGGIIWVLPLLWMLLFTTVDFVVGDMAKYPWGLMVVVWFAHAAPETLLGGMIYFIGYGNFGMLLAIVVVTRFAPIIGALFTGRPGAPSTRSISRARPILTEVEG